MQTCPNGHQSAYAYWCEVCGSPMTAALSAPAAPVFGYGCPPAGETIDRAEACPQCWTPRGVAAPFCEACRYTFAQGSPAVYTADAPQVGMVAGDPSVGIPPPQSPSVFPHAPIDHHGSRPSRVARPAEPLGHEDGWLLPPPGLAEQLYGQQYFQQEYQQPSQQQQQQQQEYVPPSQVPPSGGSAWSATVGPDRSYFMAMMQQSGPEAAGLNLPAGFPERHLALSGPQITIGRRAVSWGEPPDIDLSVPPQDPGVSQQHAWLVQQSDGTWAVMDRNSTNGTTINGADEPIQPYVPIPLGDGDQVHIGAWTTITVRHG